MTQNTEIRKQFEQLNNQIINRIIDGGYDSVEFHNDTAYVNVGGIIAALWLRRTGRAEPWDFLTEDTDIHLAAGVEQQELMYKTLIKDFNDNEDKRKELEIKALEEKLAKLKAK